MVLGAILRPYIRQLGQYIYTGLRQQDRLVDYTYRKTGLYNRGVVRGVKHGLAGGQIIGGTLQLGLNAPDTPGNDNALQTKVQRKRSQTRSPYKTRRRQTNRYCPERKRSDKFNRN